MSWKQVVAQNGPKAGNLTPLYGELRITNCGWQRVGWQYRLRRSLDTPTCGLPGLCGGRVSAHDRRSRAFCLLDKK